MRKIRSNLSIILFNALQSKKIPIDRNRLENQQQFEEKAANVLKEEQTIKEMFNMFIGLKKMFQKEASHSHLSLLLRPFSPIPLVD